MKIFDVQDKVIEHILQSAKQQQAAEAAPKRLDPIQQQVATILRDHLSQTSADREQIRALRKWVVTPMPNVYIKELRALVKTFDTTRDFDALWNSLRGIVKLPSTNISQSQQNIIINIADLHLICYDYVWS